jgi:hypothetical protein
MYRPEKKIEKRSSETEKARSGTVSYVQPSDAVKRHVDVYASRRKCCLLIVITNR